MLDPLRASRRIRDEYRRYLSSAFPLRREELRAQFEEQLDRSFALSKGPILQASAPYVTGATVRDLVEEGVLADGFLRLSRDAFDLDRPLYVHQEQAIRKAVGDRRNLMVATGTGSGKTETFLLPIIDHLLREAEQGTLRRPGVRALLLYPMNALANDQLKRLRVLLADLPEITFGRYVGETREEQRDAEDDFARRYPFEPRLDNELISRQRMQERPPHLLLTNYAMLEYLLLRPADSSLFDGPSGERWRFLALDEIHVYGGAEGTEIGMLLRRVRDRVIESRRGVLQCFGTSATLGRGESDYPDLVAFAEALFDEPFEWTGDPARQDVIGATRKPLVRHDASRRLEPEQLTQLRALARDGGSPTELASVAGLPAPLTDASHGDVLTRALAEDERVIELQRRLERGSVDLAETARDLFDGHAEPAERLVDLVDLGVLARHGDDDAPLMPARYHFFLRALEGAFICLHPEHPADAPSLLLSRHERCPACARVGQEAIMVELGACRRCGAEYAIGKLDEADGPRKLQPAPPLHDRPLRLLLGEALAEGEDDEDEEFSGGPGDEAIAAWLCGACGVVSEGASSQCECERPPQPVRVWIARAAVGQDGPRRCLACARRTAGDPVTRFLTGSDAPVSVIATDLYQEIPPSSDDRARDEIGQGRKLLTFSDSRQDAAFFAPYLERTYRRAVERRLIAAAIEDERDHEPRADDLIDPVVRAAERSLVLDPDDSRASKRNAVATWLTRELVALDRRQSLEGTGAAEIRLAFPRRHRPPPPLLAMGFSADEADDLIRLLLDTLRHGGAIRVLEGADIRDEAFAPRNREISVRHQGSAPGVLSWMPARNLNGRLDLLQRICERKGIDADPREILDGVWKFLTQPGGDWSKTLVQVHGEHEGAVWRLAADRFELVPGLPERAPSRCDRCGQLWWRSVAGVCPAYRCSGTVAPVDDVGRLVDNHYARLYRELAPVGMSVEEHTAQWVSSKASAIQDEFVRGRINVLSCSTTFELGVDVGEVQAVLLRNVPPSPANYIQRAGRAGRRTDAAALVVTFAQRRSHDLTYFERPSRMVDGMIPPPRIVLDNAPIVRRHVHSVAFAAFQREVGDHRTVEDFFLADDGATRDKDFVRWLQSKPDAVGAALKRVVPASVQEPLGLNEWTWVNALVEPSLDDPTHGWLGRAGSEVRQDVEDLQAMVDEAAAEENFPRAGKLKRVRKSITHRRLLEFLASRNVLPKYGFPVDVVELNLARTGDDLAASLELSRDLKMAIADYAPGAVTVAGKKLWRSEGLVVRQDRSWPVYGWAVCDACGAFRHRLEEAAEECPSCGSTATTRSGRFVVPIYGFAGTSAQTPGETRPPRKAMMETFFGSYREEPPAFEPVPEISNGVGVERRFSRQGRITVVNRGPVGAGFRLCEWCGFAEPVIQGKRPKKTHRRLDRPSVECRGTLRVVHLGHEYLTDVIELRLDQPLYPDEARSTLYALLEAAPSLDVARDDIDGTLHYYAANHPSFVLFDAVPGGAGHTLRIGKRLPDLISAARARVEECECGPETSCYSCLRSYSNQIWHEVLSRGDAFRVLDRIAV